MPTFWSTEVQSPRELYESRALRFREDNAEKWLSAMGIEPHMRVLELGCGPGLFCHRIAKACPHAHVTGLDRDRNMLSFAREQAERLGVSCRFVEGDALAGSLPSASFDLVFSYTVAEHVEPAAFLAEQLRLLSSGGKICVMSVRPKMGISPANVLTPLELRLWEQLSAAMPEPEEGRVGVNPCEPGEMAAQVEQAGFSDVAVQFLTVCDYAPDSADVSAELAAQMLAARLTAQLEPIFRAREICEDALLPGDWEQLRRCVEAREKQRRFDYERGNRRWEISATTSYIVTGRK